MDRISLEEALKVAQHNTDFDTWEGDDYLSDYGDYTYKDTDSQVFYNFSNGITIIFNRTTFIWSAVASSAKGLQS
jgi:hypothetical protein